jgi:2,5-diketo-D-gluconate reductase B
VAVGPRERHRNPQGRPESQKADLDALGISLDDEDRAAIAALPKDQRFVRPPFAPEWDAVA